MLRGLSRWLPAVPPQAEFRWAGVFGESPDGLPYIGPVPGRPGVFVALGFGGNGVTFAVVAAELLSRLVDGEEPEHLPLLALDRGGH